MMSFKLKFSPLALLALSVLLLGCTAVTPGAAPTSNPRDQFELGIESDVGTAVHWSGYSDGYYPGGPVVLEITLQNDTQQDWIVPTCVQLVDMTSVIATLAQRTWTLQPQMGITDELPGELPDDLEPGSYGLVLVNGTPDGQPFVSLQHIRVLPPGSNDLSGFPELSNVTPKTVDAAIEMCLSD